MVRTFKARGITGFLALCLVFAAGCEADEGTDLGPLEIIGIYTDSYGGPHEITATSWRMSEEMGKFAITQYDNAGKWLVARNDATNQFSPDLWSRMDWTRTADGTLYFCQTRYNAETEAEALAAEAADPADPATAGCSGFAWTLLTPKAAQ